MTNEPMPSGTVLSPEQTAIQKRTLGQLTQVAERLQRLIGGQAALVTLSQLIALAAVAEFQSHELAGRYLHTVADRVQAGAAPPADLTLH